MFGYRDHLSLIASIVVLSILAAGLAQAERVAGSSIVEKASSVEDVLYDLLAQPLTQAEVDLFLKHTDAVLTWAEAHSEEWLAADESDNPLAVIRGFAIWQKVDVTSAEFVSLVGKLMFAREFAHDPMDVVALKRELAQMSGFYNSGQLTPDQAAQVQAAIDQLNGLLKVLQGGAADNVALYKENKAAIDAALDRFEAIQSETEGE